MSCILKINNIYGELQGVDKKICEYILENKDDFIKLSISEMANKINVSTASLVRFSRKLGYNGYSDLKLELAKDINISENKYSYIEEFENFDIKNIILNMKNKNINIIEETIQLNNSQDMEKIVDIINIAKNIYIFGVGASGLIALDFQMKLLRINKMSFATLDTHSQLTASTNLNKKDVVIAISYSGLTKEVIQCVENANSVNCNIISITKYGNNEISKLSNYNLYVPNIEKEFREGALSSRIATLMLIDIIYISLIQKNIKNSSKKLENSVNTIKKFKHNLKSIN